MVRSLKEYAIFVSKVRMYNAKLPFAEAVEQAITECICEGVLEKFLRKNRAEVLSVSIFEYDEELHMRLERRDAKEEGLRKGEQIKLIDLIRKKLNRGMEAEEIAQLLEEDVGYVKMLCDLIREHQEEDSRTISERWQA